MSISVLRDWYNSVVRPQLFQRGIEVEKAAVLQKGHGFVLTSDGDIPYGCAVGIISGDVLVATHGLQGVLGVNANDDGSAAEDGDSVLVGVGKQYALAATALSAGDPLKAYAGGKLGPMATSAVAGTDFITAQAGGNFGNQPADDALEIVSDDAGDTTQSITIYGTTHGTTTVVSETIALTGTDAVTTVKDDWGIILGVELSAACAGTITVAEASADQTVTTITAGTTSVGIKEIASGSQRAYGVAPKAVAGGASTKYVAVYGRTTAGAMGYAVKQLDGTTAVEFGTAFEKISRVFIGDVASSSVATVEVGAAENTEGVKVGTALADAEEDALFLAAL